MCRYCEETFERNEYEREFGKSFEKESPFSGEMCVSWITRNGQQEQFELYVNDDDYVFNISIPIRFCPKCGRKLV